MESVHVVIRIRDEPKTTENGICATSRNTLRLEHSDVSPGVADIGFEQVFNAQATQQDIFRGIKSSIEDGFDGYNSAFISCGKEQSGKTYTVHGSKYQPGA